MTCNSLLICIFAMNGLHFLMLSEGIREHYFALSVGVQLGLIMSGVIYLGIGFFTDSQHESHFLRCLALTFKLVGFLLYSMIACVILLLCYMELEGQQTRKTNLEIIEGLKSKAFGQLKVKNKQNVVCCICLCSYEQEE